MTFFIINNVNLFSLMLNDSQTNNTYIFKNVEFDGFYQYYEMNNQINNVYLNYEFTKEELDDLSEKYSQVYININKNNTDEIKISYKLTQKADLEDFKEPIIISLLKKQI